MLGRLVFKYFYIRTMHKFIIFMHVFRSVYLSEIHHCSSIQRTFYFYFILIAITALMGARNVTKRYQHASPTASIFWPLSSVGNTEFLQRFINLIFPTESRSPYFSFSFEYVFEYFPSWFILLHSTDMSKPV